MESLPALVSFVREFFSAEALPETATFDLDLVLEELFTNIVRHGRSGRGDVELLLERTPDGIELRILEYDADPFDPTSAPAVDVNRPIEERAPGGLGIHFVRVLSQQFHYDWKDRVGTTTVRMKVGA